MFIEADVTVNTWARYSWQVWNDNEIAIVSDSNHHSYVNGGNDSGVWGASASDWTYAHEVGHLMNLPDEYSGTGTPEPGYEGTMMGQFGGSVTRDETIRDLVQANGIQCP